MFIPNTEQKVIKKKIILKMEKPIESLPEPPTSSGIDEDEKDKRIKELEKELEWVTKQRDMAFEMLKNSSSK